MTVTARLLRVALVANLAMHRVFPAPGGPIASRAGRAYRRHRLELEMRIESGAKRQYRIVIGELRRGRHQTLGEMGRQLMARERIGDVSIASLPSGSGASATGAEEPKVAVVFRRSRP